MARRPAIYKDKRYGDDQGYASDFLNAPIDAFPMWISLQTADRASGTNRHLAPNFPYRRSISRDASLPVSHAFASEASLRGSRVFTVRSHPGGHSHPCALMPSHKRRRCPLRAYKIALSLVSQGCDPS
jgi:hypothetical protein